MSEETVSIDRPVIVRREGGTIEIEVEVVGTPEEVWRAVATGPGITSWYVPHEVDEEAGGQALARFGPGDEMKVPGRVAEWEPPRRVVFDGGGGDGDLAFEWLVEARDGDTCVVRMINTGFGQGGEWDDHFDAMVEGWRIFMTNLGLHLRHFGGDSAAVALPIGSWPKTPEDAFRHLAEAAGLKLPVKVGDRVRFAAPEVADPVELVADVIDVAPARLTLMFHEPAPGTGFLAGEHQGGEAAMSMWAYLYGPDRDELVDRLYKEWHPWFNAEAERLKEG